MAAPTMVALTLLLMTLSHDAVTSAAGTVKLTSPTPRKPLATTLFAASTTVVPDSPRVAFGPRRVLGGHGGRRLDTAGRVDRTAPPTPRRRKEGDAVWEPARPEAITAQEGILVEGATRFGGQVSRCGRCGARRPSPRARRPKVRDGAMGVVSGAACHRGRSRRGRPRSRGRRRRPAKLPRRTGRLGGAPGPPPSYPRRAQPALVVR